MSFYERMVQAKELLTAFFAVVVALVYFVIDNRHLSETVQELEQSNKTLEEKVANHSGQIEGFNHAVKMFMENPPGLIMNELQELEEDMKRHHPDHTSHEAVADRVESIDLPGEN